MSELDFGTRLHHAIKSFREHIRSCGPYGGYLRTNLQHGDDFRGNVGRRAAREFHRSSQAGLSYGVYEEAVRRKNHLGDGFDAAYGRSKSTRFFDVYFYSRECGQSWKISVSNVLKVKPPDGELLPESDGEEFATRHISRKMYHHYTKWATKCVRVWW